MPLKEPLPKELLGLLPANGESEPRVSVVTDLNEETCYAVRWLAVTDDRILVMEPNGGSPHVALELPLNQITEVKTRPLVGAGLI